MKLSPNKSLPPEVPSMPMDASYESQLRNCTVTVRYAWLNRLNIAITSVVCGCGTELINTLTDKERTGLNMEAFVDLQTKHQSNDTYDFNS